MENTANAKVLRARLMDQPEDFKRLGINPEEVETWEDGRRTRTEEVGSEVWYFDGTMDDGTKFMAGYRPKSMNGMTKTVDSPHVNIYIKSPEGKEFRDQPRAMRHQGGTPLVPRRLQTLRPALRARPRRRPRPALRCAHRAFPPGHFAAGLR